MRAFVLSAVLSLLVPAMVSAETTLGLSEAINLAMEKSNLLRAAAYEQNAATLGAAASRSRYLPRIYLDETASASNSPTKVFMMKLDEGRFTQNDFAIGNLNHPSTHGDFRTAITLDQPLFDLSIARDAEAAKKEEKAGSINLEKRREEVAFMVYRACLEVQKARGHLAAAEKGVVDAREHLRLAKVRSDAGTGLKSDSLRANTFLAEMEQEEISARNDLTLARMRLARQVGGAPGETADIREELRPFPVTQGVGELEALARENRQDLKAVAVELEKADIGVKKARAAWLPTLYGTASYQMNDRDIPFGRDNDSWLVGASLRWELFDGLRRVRETGKAEALRSSAAEYLEDYRKEVALQVEECRLRREEAAKRVEVARHAAEDAEEAVRLVSRRFENSIATFADLLDAQTALNRARARIIDNESDYALASARIYFATGTFLKEVMK